MLHNREAFVVLGCAAPCCFKCINAHWHQTTNTLDDIVCRVIANIVTLCTIDRLPSPSDRKCQEPANDIFGAHNLTNVLLNTAGRTCLKSITSTSNVATKSEAKSEIFVEYLATVRCIDHSLLLPHVNMNRLAFFNSFRCARACDMTTFNIIVVMRQPLDKTDMDSNNKFIHATRQWTKETHSEAEKHDEITLNVAVRRPFRNELAHASLQRCPFLKYFNPVCKT